MRFSGIIFDFDGVLIDSEYVGNSQIAAFLSSAGHPTTVEQSMAQFMGLADRDFHAAVERWIGGPLPDDFHAARAAEDARVMAEGIDEIRGAIGFVQSLPSPLPKAIASSSSTRWIARHLDHIGLRDIFGDRIFSGKEHVKRGKPAPDLYLHAAQAIGVPIEQCVILEDSPVGATGAVASGAHVIGLCAGMHCGADHAAVLRDIGVHAIAHDFDDVARLIS
ncbi:MULTISPECIES: HAD family phosphatase [unclassified Sphingomonas]|uniref:HAD family hydrolase n=1 Tax=unclassified Sphingomonas TaxID=196159 RepID=UPI000BC84909|nr:MAG: haloacid dehalogenase [Sphingomonas sp. 12-62-6]OYX38765.1 MAG: haloacid dehalogenase [Sphingomonas sp. 32-62-10]